MPVSGDAHLNFGKVFGAEKTRMMRLSTSYAEENVMLRRLFDTTLALDRDGRMDHLSRIALLTRDKN